MYDNSSAVHSMSILFAESEYDSIQQDIPRKMHIYETQEFSQNDVKQINAERETLRRQIAKFSEEIEAVDKDIWTEEMSLGKGRDLVRVLSAILALIDSVLF